MNILSEYLLEKSKEDKKIQLKKERENRAMGIGSLVGAGLGLRGIRNIALKQKRGTPVHSIKRIAVTGGLRSISGASGGALAGLILSKRAQKKEIKAKERLKREKAKEKSGKI